MKRVKFLSFFGVFVVSFCCYADVQSEIESGWQKMYEGDFAQARSHYSSIISSEASSADKSSASLCLAWVGVFEAIDSGQYGQAKTAVDVLKSQHSKNWALGIYVFRTAEKMEWSNQLDIAKKLYADAILLDDAYSAKATWREAWITIFQQIEAGNIEALNAVVDHMQTQFPNNPELSEMLFRVGERLRWKGKYDKAKEFYAKSIEVSSEGRFAQQSQFENLWVDTLTKIDHHDYESADTNINNMLADFSGNSKMADALYSFAERYRWMGYYSKVEDIYKKIIQQYSSSEAAGKVNLDAAVVNILAMIEPGNEKQVDTALAGLESSLHDASQLNDAILLAGEQYYLKGCDLSVQGQYASAESYFQKSINLWIKVKSRVADNAIKPGFWDWAGYCYKNTGQFDKSLECFKKKYELYPDNSPSQTLLLIGQNYESLSASGSMPKAEFSTNIKAVYGDIVKLYPDTAAAKYARKWLSGQIN